MTRLALLTLCCALAGCAVPTTDELKAAALIAAKAAACAVARDNLVRHPDDLLLALAVAAKCGAP